MGWDRDAVLGIPVVNQPSHSAPGSAVLIAYTNQGVDMNWLLTGKSVTTPKPKKRKQVPIKGKRFRVRGRRSVCIPHYDPFDPDSFNPDNPDSVITLDPSRLTAFTPYYVLRGRDWAELATTTVISDDLCPELKIGTLVLFDTASTIDPPQGRRVVRKTDHLEIRLAEEAPQEGVIGQAIFAFARP
jgi:hypothetical protein